MMSKTTNNPLYKVVEQNSRFWVQRTTEDNKYIVEVAPAYPDPPPFLLGSFGHYVMTKVGPGKDIIREVFNLIVEQYETEYTQYSAHIVNNADQSVEYKEAMYAINEISSPNMVPTRAMEGGFAFYPSMGMGQKPHDILVRNVHLWEQSVKTGGKVNSICARRCEHPECADYYVQLKTVGSPVYRAANAFVSGGSSKGLVKTLHNMIRFNNRGNINPIDFTVVYLNILKRCKWNPQPVRFTQEYINSLDLSLDKSSGFLPYKDERHIFVDEICEQILHYTNVSTQGAAREQVNKDFMELIVELRKKIMESPYREDWFPTLCWKMSLKGELRAYTADPDKTRIIFIASMLHLLMDKCIYTDFIKSFYQREGFMVGHQWRRGGAEHIANMLGWNNPKLFWGETDQDKFDNNVMPDLETLIMMMSNFLYPYEDHVDDKIRQALGMERAHGLACKIVKWPGLDFRYVIGILPSGALKTSLLGTIYLILAFRYVCRVTYLNIKAYDKAKAERFKHSVKGLAQFGDDSLYSFEKEFFEDIVGASNVDLDHPLGLFSRYFRSIFLLKSKPNASGVAIFGMYPLFGTDPGVNADGTPHSAFLTRIQTEYINKKPYKTTILYQGPVFLKRAFVMLRNSKGESGIFPYRHENDYFDRAAVSSTCVDLDFNRYASKYLGLMIDTCATNPVAYSFCKFMYQKMRYLAADFVINEEEIKKFRMKMGVQNLGLEGILNPTRLFSEFKWDDIWRNTWARLLDVPLYDCYGNEVEPSGFFARPDKLELPTDEWEEYLESV